MPLRKLTSECRRLGKAFGYSFQGLRAAWGEPAFRVEVVAMGVAVPVALMVACGPAERALLIGSVMLVLIVELLNTAIEAAINRISLELHPLSKRAKDVASAAVLLAILNATAIWLAVLWK